MKLRYLVSLVACLALSPVSAGEPRPPERHLFLDPALITQPQGVTVRVNPAERRDLVICAENPWEAKMISLFLTVMEDQGKLRMWYVCRDKDDAPNVAYAESSDGITWRKPNLGIVMYKGSTDNNLVGLTSLEGNVFRDPNGTPGKEYVYVTPVNPDGMVRFTSPDGLRWNRDKTTLLTFLSDTQNVTLFDPELQKYVMFLRGWDWRTGGNSRMRRVVRTTFDDLSKPVRIPSIDPATGHANKRINFIHSELPVCLAADERDPAAADVYNLSTVVYPPAPQWYLGFPSFLLREEGFSNGRVEVQFAASRDKGVTWERYDRVPYARPGLAGSDSANVAYMGQGIAVRGNELWQYGMTLKLAHGPAAHKDRSFDGSIYRYVQRLDGFVSVDFDPAGGKFVSAPVVVEGPRLRLNVDTAALGSLRVGLLDEAGTPIPGFTIDDCHVIHTNDTAREVVWKIPTNDLTSLKGKKVRLVFAGDRTKLFSFSFGDTAK